ncbi:MAG: TonB-dependent siderophore receptor [Pseudomonadota bacterium]
MTKRGGGRAKFGWARPLAVGAVLLIAQGLPAAAQDTRLNGPYEPVRLAQAERSYDFDIASKPLPQAVADFSAVTGLQVLYTESSAADRTAPALRGRFTAGQALDLLLAGSGLRYRFTSATAITLERTVANGDSGATALDPITVEGKTESAYGPVDGYRAERSATATKTDTPIREIPNAIQVIPQQVISDQQAISIEEVLENAAAVTFFGTNNGRGLLFGIRGFEDVPLLRDGLNASGFGIAPAEVEVANLERVEVVRGPAVLYGRAEPGGAINLVTKKPLDEPYYNVTFQAGNRGLVSPIVDVSGPVTEDGSLLYRFVGLYRRQNAFQDYDESYERVFVAPSVTWKPNRKSDLTVRVEYTKDKDPLIYGLPSSGTGVVDIPFDRVTNNPTDFIDQETLIAGYEFEHRFNTAWKLRNQFSYVRGTFDTETFAAPFSFDDTSGILNRFFTFQDSQADTFAADTNIQGKFRTGPFDHTGLIGFDLTTEINSTDAGASFALGLFSPIDIFDPDYFATPVPAKSDLPLVFSNDFKSRQLGLYVQDQIDILDNLILVGGFRVDDYSATTKSKLTNTVTQDSDDRAFSPRAGVVYRPLEPVSLYANYSQSFQPTSATDASGDILPPEEGEGFEAGVKVDFVRDRLSSTLAFFNITKSNVATGDPVFPFASVATGEQRSRGFDVDLTGEILPGWNVIASYAFIDAEVTKDNDPTLVGNNVAGVPRHSGSVWTTYEFQGGPLKGLGGGIGFNYVGERPGDLANSFDVDGYVIANAGLSYRWRNWQLRLNAENLFDTDYIEFVEGFAANGNIPGAPFTIRGSISATF